MKILFLGDVVGRPGRNKIRQRITALRHEYGLDAVIANGENASGGIGLSAKNAQELKSLGVDVVTSGNHIWRQKDIYQFMNENPWVVRPANFPPSSPGYGFGVFESRTGLAFAVINLVGRTYMDPADCPFRKADEVLETLSGKCAVIFVDFHAEATSEKIALGYYLDGRVSAVIGTHTHVQTNDATVLAKGCAYITDVGMCGPKGSVLGMEREGIVRRFITNMPSRFEVAENEAGLEGVIVEADESSGRALSIMVIRE